MKKAEYHRYLASRDWALLKEQVRERSGGACERCATQPDQRPKRRAIVARLVAKGTV